MSSPAQHICMQIAFPICKSLNLPESPYRAEYGIWSDSRVENPYTTILIFISILCGIRMILHVNQLHSAIGRDEMRSIFYSFIFSNVIQLCIVGFPSEFDKKTFLHANVLHSAMENTTYFMLIISTITIERTYGVFGLRASSLLEMAGAGYFLFLSIVVFLFTYNEISMIIPLLFLLNCGMFFYFIIRQIKKLKISEFNDFWTFGVLGVTLVFFGLCMIHTIYLGGFVAYLSAQNIDNLFMYNFYRLVVLMMVHKFWLSIYDYEPECLEIGKNRQ